jgi:hypothetical protein
MMQVVTILIRWGSVAAVPIRKLDHVPGQIANPRHLLCIADAVVFAKSILLSSWLNFDALDANVSSCSVVLVVPSNMAGRTDTNSCVPSVNMSCKKSRPRFEAP